MLKEANGEVRVEHDRHIEGLFPRAVWLYAFGSAGLSAATGIDTFGRDVFIATRDETP